MSIISEALKKAEKQANLKTVPRDINLSTNAEEGLQQKEVLISKVSKETSLLLVLGIAAIVLSSAMLGSIIFIKDIILSKVVIENRESNLQKAESQSSNFYKVALETPGHIIELNGIVYESNDKWAIINNRIVRIGDSVGNERVVEIGKDYVRLANGQNSTERTLNLR